MKLWSYLKERMKKYGPRVAFASAGLTYTDLISLAENAPIQNKLVLCEGDTREMQALEVLKAIAGGSIVVPVTKEYGAYNYEHIKATVEKANIEELKDVAFLMFTSGTTGSPKGVMLTHENIISNLDAITSYFALNGMKSICIGRPLVHIAVLTGELLYALCSGLTIYFFEEAFVAQRLLSYLVRHQIDIFCATPTLYHALSMVDRTKIFPIKIGVLSGEVLSEKLALKISETFPNTAFYNVYGLTEHSPRVSALLPSEFRLKPGSVGRAIKDVSIKIIDGELVVKSDSVMKGYYADKEQTQKKKKRGWLYTGDRAHCDEEGYLYIDGRKDGMLIRAGINIYPEEIEALVQNIPGVVDCLVYGEIFDMGTRICMEYTGQVDAKEIRKHISAVLNPSVIPSKIKKVDMITRTASGKKVRK